MSAPRTVTSSLTQTRVIRLPENLPEPYQSCGSPTMTRWSTWSSRFRSRLPESDIAAGLGDCTPAGHHARPLAGHPAVTLLVPAAAARIFSVSNVRCHRDPHQASHQNDADDCLRHHSSSRPPAHSRAPAASPAARGRMVRTVRIGSKAVAKRPLPIVWGDGGAVRTPPSTAGRTAEYEEGVAQTTFRPRNRGHSRSFGGHQRSPGSGR